MVEFGWLYKVYIAEWNAFFYIRIAECIIFHGVWDFSKIYRSSKWKEYEFSENKHIMPKEAKEKYITME